MFRTLSLLSPPSLSIYMHSSLISIKGLAMDELFESEVMWDEYQSTSADSSTRSRSRNMNAAASTNFNSTSTAPMKIPAARRSSRASECGEAGDDRVLVPPHVLVSRTGSSGKMAFSVCSGQGRTLKGRDLTHVRDSVMRMTGYLEI